MSLEPNCCRLCLAQEGSGEMLPVFKENSKIAFDIFLICQVKILEFINEMPALICNNCHKELDNATNFRERCKSSDVVFRENFLNIEENALKEICDKNIKNEPVEELNVDLFEEVDDENISGDAIKNSNDDSLKEQENNSEIAQCKLCLKNFTSVHSLRDHMRAIHQDLDENDMYRCEYCDRLFKMKYYLSEYSNLSEDIHEYVYLTIFRSPYQKSSCTEGRKKN